ncbi:MAG: hypothetical protein KME64_40385 [Scytonematopsis contorta HA4267-MV1]|jgi:ElaB/YqjD/DUF883 family membrane-anchored ribosome-binding protein|nr:hypothetical protein [Scytonematopsis contorta HA4267-MV1]
MSKMNREEIRERLGNIDQIRDIIFGVQLRENENRFCKLESDVLLLQTEMLKQFEQLRINFAGELKTAVETLEKRLKSTSLNTQEETADLQQQVDRLNRKFSHSLQSIDEELSRQSSSIRSEAFESKSKFEDDITALRDLVLEELELRFSQLSESKISRDDMAETLFVLGMRLKGSELIPELGQARNESSKHSLVSF